MDILSAIVCLVAVGSVLLMGALLVGAWLYEFGRDLWRAMGDDPARDVRRDSEEDLP